MSVHQPLHREVHPPDGFPGLEPPELGLEEWNEEFERPYRRPIPYFPRREMPAVPVPTLPPPGERDTVIGSSAPERLRTPLLRILLFALALLLAGIFFRMLRATEIRESPPGSWEVGRGADIASVETAHETDGRRTPEKQSDSDRQRLTRLPPDQQVIAALLFILDELRMRRPD